MNNKYLIVLMFSLISVKLFAQQNFFNVPSSDITKKNKIFMQQQMNLFRENISSNSTFCYGLGKNYEIGLNILGVTYNYSQKKLVSNFKNEQPVYPSLGINIQKQIVEFRKYSLALGGQLLFTFNDFEYYTYLNNKIKLNRTTLVAGLYFGNNNYFGNEARFINGLGDIGLQCGLEYQVIRDKLFFQTDFISGNTPSSNLIVGGAYKFTKKFIISMGYQIPNNKNVSSSGLIFELTFIQ